MFHKSPNEIHDPSSSPASRIDFSRSAPLGNSNAVFHFGDFQLDPQHADPLVPKESSKQPSPDSSLYPGKRVFRPNPLLQRPEDARDRRRGLFLKKLQARRDDKVMQARGGEDEMLRLIYLSEKNRWEDSQERAAVALSSWKATSIEEPYEGVELLDPSSGGIPTDLAMVDTLADLEERELQDAISYFNHSDSTSKNPIQLSCPDCRSDEILDSPNGTICFNCGRDMMG